MQTALLPRPSLTRLLEQRLDAALQGGAPVCVVIGDPGTGKTQLIQQFATEAQSRQQDLLVAYSACNAITGIADAYMPFREILRHLAGDVDESLSRGQTNAGNVSRIQNFMQTSARALVENGPDLVDVFVPGGALMTRLGAKFAQRFSWFEKLATQVNARESGTIVTDLKQDNIFEQYTRVIEAMSEQAPLLLIVDDLHWSDQASLGLLFQLARRLVDNRVLIVAATRPPADSAENKELRNLLSELQRYFGEVVVNLSAQPEDQFIREYLEAIGIPADSVTTGALVQQTGGNPLYVVELLRQAATAKDINASLRDIVDGNFPARMSGIFERLFKSLSDADRQILATASVQGFEFWAELVADVQNESPLTVMRRFGSTLMRDRNIVVDDGVLDLASGPVSRFRFRHDLLREYVYQSQSENERRLLHKMVAEQMESRTTESPEAYCMMLAEQFAKARDWGKALRYRVLAAERTERACAPTDTAMHYSIAIELCNKMTPIPATTLFDLRLRLVSQLTLIGDSATAEELAHKALDSATDAKQALVAWLAISNLLERRRDHAKALQALDQAEAVLPAANKSDEDWKQAIDILLERAVINYFQADRAALATTNQTLAELIEVHGEPRQRVAYFNSRSRQALTDNRFSPQEDAVRFSQKALDSVQGVSPATAFGLGFATLWQEDFGPAIELLQKAESLAAQHGDLVVRMQSLVYLSFAQRRSGNVEAVDALVAQISSLLEQIKMPDYPALLQAQMSWLAYRRGDQQRASTLARSALQGWQDQKSGYPLRWTANWVIFALAEPGSSEALDAARSMLSPEQAWQRDAVVAALKNYLGDSVTMNAEHATVISIAKREKYL